MKVHFSIVGYVEQYDDVWVELDAIPRLGETVELPYIEESVVVVRTVVWYPQGSDEYPDLGQLPHVYIVLGPPRP